MTESARSLPEVDLDRPTLALVTTPKITCARCGDPESDHRNRDGQPLQGRRASRFTGYGFCNKQHLSGGIAGSLQWCGCLGFEESER